ncbi:hypothetical protein BJY01DRAFT_248103 [Aspergillus pseudoustus]|uniref:C2H2-type domain-containing protein n=1 Tax=Aspergillus pseudoustus TaxID=1810923 RepID=A0ABR4JX77_9EURO
MTNFTIVNGQIYTPGLAIVDAPQPYTPLGGDTLHIALDVSGNGQLSLTPDDDAPTRFHEITIFLTSSETERNFTVSNGTDPTIVPLPLDSDSGSTSNGSIAAYTGPILSLEPGSTVKHINWIWPECFVGDGDSDDKDGARGNYNISMHQSFRWNETDYYTVFDLPISVSNGIDESDERVDCALLENGYKPALSQESSQDLPGQPFVGDGVATTEIEGGDEGNMAASGLGISVAKVLRWAVVGLIVGALANSVNMSQGQWQCGLCSTQFSRAEHLRRHLRSHENKRPYECSLCQRSFTRRDAKTRHEKTCKAATQSPAASANLTQAPSLLLGVNNNSLYGNGMEDDFLMGNPYPSDFAALDWLYSTNTRMSSDSIITAERLDFLAHFTSENGMGTFLAPEKLEERQSLIRKHEPSQAASHGHGHGSSLTSTIPLGTLQTIEPSMLHITTSEDLDPLTARTYEILHHLHNIITAKSNKSVVKLDWTPDIEFAARSFFSPRNITRYLGYFWSLWYPNCPFVHRASFDPQTAPPALLCVMVMIGACLSPHAEDAVRARMWLNVVEELAFSDSSFWEEKDTDSGGKAAVLEQYVGRKRKRLECVQTAYLVCSLQKREGDGEARARVRRYRHATMVMLARDIGLATASHRSLSMDNPSDAWWQQFAVEEGLIRFVPFSPLSGDSYTKAAMFRTITYVFLFDVALTIFHNSPPRMVVSELKMEMACPEACFQAESAEECFRLLKEWETTIFWNKRLSITSLLKSICQTELTSLDVDEYSHMGSLNLFTTVQTIHSLTFHLRNSIIFESTLLPLKTGLENWRRIWNKREAEDKYVPDTPDQIWKKVGFISYSPEFWHLARIIVERIEGESHDTEDEEGEDVRNGAVGGETKVMAVGKGQDRWRVRYDHTDMTDVNGLIMEYRRLSLGGV